MLNNDIATGKARIAQARMDTITNAAINDDTAWAAAMAKAAAKLAA